MALEIPKSRLNVRQIQTQQRRIPLEQILAVEGQSPISTGIEVAGDVLGKTLQKRAELKRQGEQLAKLETLAGQQPGSFEGLDPSMAASFTEMAMKKKNEQELLQQGLGSRGGTGYITPRGVDTQSGRPVYSNSKKAGLFYDDGTQFKDQPGKLNLQALPEAQIEKESSLATLKFALDKIKSSYDPEYVGPIGSRIGKGKQYIEGAATPEATDFYSNVADLRNQIVYLRSGKQINETEYKRLLDALPNENLSPTDFSQRLSNTVKMIQEIESSRQKALSGSGYRTSTGLSPIEPTPPREIPVLTGKKKSLAEKLGL